MHKSGFLARNNSSSKLLSGAALRTAPSAPLGFPGLSGDNLTAIDPSFPTLEPGGSVLPATGSDAIFVVEGTGFPLLASGQAALLQQIIDGGDPELGRELENFQTSNVRLSTAAAQDFVTRVTEGVRSGCSFR